MVNTLRHYATLSTTEYRSKHTSETDETWVEKFFEGFVDESTVVSEIREKIKNKELTEEIRKLSKLINLLLGKPDDKNKRKN